MRVKRLRTINIYDIGKTESYLSDMAKEGLFLIGVKGLYYIFKKKEPAEIEYRMEFGEKVLDPKLLELYELSGWKHTCSLKGIHIFQAPASDILVEPHTDTEEQSDTLQKCCGKLKRLISIEIGLLMAVVIDAVLASGIGKTPVLNQLTSNFMYLYVMVLFFYIIFEFARNLHTLTRIKKKLRMGMGIDHHEPWRKVQGGLYIEWLIVGIILVLSLTSTICNIYTLTGYFTGRTHYVISLDSKLPVVRLNSVEKLEAPVIRAYYSDENKHPLSDVDVKYYLFLKQMEVNEQFIQKDMLWGKDIYEPSLRSNYYKVTLPFMVQGALSDVLHKAENYFAIGMPDHKIKAEKIVCSGLEEVYYIPSEADREHYFALVIRKSNTIIWMIYCGQKDRTEVIKASQILFNESD